MRFNEEGVYLSEEEALLVVGWVPEVEDADEEHLTLPEHDQASATAPITSNLLCSCHRCSRGRCFKRRKIFCSLWLRVPVCVVFFWSLWFVLNVECWVVRSE